MAKIIVAVEIPNVTADEVATVLVEHLGATLVSLKVSTEFETIVL